MNKLRLPLVASGIASLSLAAGAVHASTLELDVNGDAARIHGSWASETTSLTFDAGALHHQDFGTHVQAGLHLVDSAMGGTDSPLHAGVGGRLVAIEDDFVGLDGQALAVGGFFRYVFPEYNRLGVAGSLYFAPDVITFGDLEQYVATEFRVQYHVLRQADVYLGVRNIRGDYAGAGDHSLETGLHLGVHIEF